MAHLSADVVLLCGPPFAGKTIFYHETLSRSHLRVCPEELYRENPSTTIRQVVNRHVVKHLTQSRKVAIDDDFQTQGKRKSFISLIKKKVPDADCLCCFLSPRHGTEQLRWAWEYSLAQGALSHSLGALSSEQSAAREDRGTVDIDAWIAEHEPPEDTGGCQVEQVERSLVAESFFKFEVPAMIVQWEALVGRVGGGGDETWSLSVGAQRVREVCSLWYKTNPCGRVVFIREGNAAIQRDQRESGVLPVMRDVVLDLSACPVYALFVSSHLNGPSYRGPPHPGLLVCLQQIHCLDYTHPGSLYLYHSQDHRKMAENMGLKHLKASRVFSNPALVNSWHSASQPEIPVFLRDLKVQTPNDSNPFWRKTRSAEETTPTNNDFPPVTTETQSTNEDVSLPAYVPLCGEYRSSPATVTQLQICPGRTLMVFCKDCDTMERYQDLYCRNASRSSDPEESKIRMMSAHIRRVPDQRASGLRHKGSVRGLPDWMRPKESGSRIKKRQDSSSVEDQGRASSLPRKRSGPKTSSVQYVMSLEELLDTARSVLHEAGVSHAEVDKTHSPQKLDPSRSRQEQESASSSKAPTSERTRDFRPHQQTATCEDKDTCANVSANKRGFKTSEDFCSDKKCRTESVTEDGQSTKAVDRIRDPQPTCSTSSKCDVSAILEDNNSTEGLELPTEHSKDSRISKNVCVNERAVSSGDGIMKDKNGASMPHGLSILDDLI